MLRTKLGLTAGQFLQKLGSQYEPVEPAYSTLMENCERLDLVPVGVNPEEYRSKHRVTVQCKLCLSEYETTNDSLRGSKLGCKFCKSGNASWELRETELEERANQVGSTLVSNIPKSQAGYIDLKCLECSTVYRTQLVGLTHPRCDNRATCPACRGSNRSVVYDNLSFDSQFERECYKLLRVLPNLRVHVPYKDLASCNRRWSADFVIDSTIVEVSNFKVDFKDYSKNIQDKKDWAISRGLGFEFLTTLEEVESFILRYSPTPQETVRNY